LSFSKFLQEFTAEPFGCRNQAEFFISTCFQILHSLHSPAAFALCAPTDSAEALAA